MRNAILLPLFSSLLLIYVSFAAWCGHLRVPWLTRQVTTVMAGHGAYVAGISCHERRKAAVLGALVADAATMPLHWYASCTVRATVWRMSTFPADFRKHHQLRPHQDIRTGRH